MKNVIITTALVSLLAVPAFAESHGGGETDGVPGAKFIAEWDLNGDGTVTVDDVRERRSDIFASFDNDDNGILDAAEYAAFDEARASAHAEEEGGNKGDRKAAVAFTLAYNDANGDGSVTLDEFLAKSADFVALIDRNGDGVITTADFGPKG